MNIETVLIQGPGGTARVPKGKVEEYLKKDGYSLVEEEPTNPDESGDSGNEITAAKIRQMSGKDLEAFVSEYELKTDLSEFKNLKDKKTAVITELNLEE